MKAKTKHRNLSWEVRKYYRWLKLYMKRVRAVENELGDAIDPC